MDRTDERVGRRESTAAGDAPAGRRGPGRPATVEPGGRAGAAGGHGDVEVDVIVVGGGPAGASCAHRLATDGCSVLVLEKDAHPRFHIGESLVPYTTRVLETMGVLDDVARGPFVRKHGVEVMDESGEHFETHFDRMADGQHKYGFNVERAPFDALLWENARRAGARTLEGAEVTGVVMDGDRVAGVRFDLAGESHEARARYVVDASGRAGVVARHFKLRRMNRRLNNVAIYQYFADAKTGVNASDRGDLVVATHRGGWVWCIPVGPQTLSVGAVMPAGDLRGTEREGAFDAHLSRAPIVSSCIEAATPVFDRLVVDSDFCYHTERFAGPGWFLAGDAACFVDPVFSGGVFLGMVSGIKAAEAVSEVLGGGDEGAAGRSYDRFCKTGYDVYFRLVYAFYYDCDLSIPCLFRSFPGRFRFVLQLLVGDFWGVKGNPALDYLRSRRDWDTFEPFEPAYGCPVYPDACFRPEDVAATP